MNLSSFVSKNMVAANLRANTKRAAIGEIVGYICSRLNLSNKNEILQSVLEREEKASTGIGDGVAIPHARLPHLEQVLFFVGISKTGIDFGAPDGKAAHIVFLFVTPETETQTHLKILSAIGNLQKNSALLDKLIGASSDSELFTTLNYEQVQRESYFPLSREEVYRELDTSEGGLSDYEARARMEIFGQNRLLTLGATPLVARFLRHVVELQNLLLWVAAVLAFAAGLPWVSVAIVAVVFLNAAFSFVREFKSEHTVDALKNLIPPVSRVIRAGTERRVSTESLVPGDILLLDRGDVIPADGRLIETNELRVDNSAFSGDPKPVYKNHEPIANREQFLWIEMPALVFAGTTVLAGSGKAVVTSTGMDTELGQIAYLTQTIKNEPSVLQRAIVHSSRLSTLATISLLVLAFVVFLLFGSGPAHGLFTKTNEIVAAGIVLGLSAIGLIPSIGIILLAAAGRMKRKGAIIKRLSSIEMLGATDVICTDKTGTLTTSEMCVKKLWLGGRVIDVSGEGYAPEGEFREGQRSITGIDLGNSEYRLFFYDAALCNNARLEPPPNGDGKWSIQGDPTEGALLTLVEKAEIDVQTIRDTYPPIRRFPFDSVRKRMSTIHATGPTRSERVKLHLLTKGAPHELLELSTKVLIEGKERTLDHDLKASIDQQIDSFAAEGMRVLGFAYRRIAEREAERSSVEEMERELVFMGVTAMHDPPRQDAYDAIRSCRAAGIRVIMITGEYQLTALSIAKRLGIVEGDASRVVTGKEISESTDDEIRRALESEELVFARVNPEHRLRVVKVLKDMGKLVAVTGDGMSDAPVLKKADIGVAMGARGNRVTQAAAEMVLSNDSFASIVSAIEEGRAVFTSIRQSVAHISGRLLPEALSFVVFLLFHVPLPLSLAALLLINLLVDLLPSAVIGIGSPPPSSMNAPPHPLSTRIIGPLTVTRDFLFQGLLTSLLATAAFVITLRHDGGIGLSISEYQSGSVFLLALIAAQLARYLSRSTHTVVWGPRRLRRLLFFAFTPVCSVGLLVAASSVPALHPVFSTSPLTGSGWVAGGAVFLIALAGAEVMKRVGRSDEKPAVQAK